MFIATASPIEPDGLLDGFWRKRQGAFCEAMPSMNMLAAIALPKSCVAARVALKKVVHSVPAALAIARFSRSVGSEKSDITGEFARHHLAGVDQKRRFPFAHGREHLA
jgi:hypothetical protein